MFGCKCGPGNIYTCKAKCVNKSEQAMRDKTAVNGKNTIGPRSR